ncbi:MAG TPA: ABC transporter substrate-binding protein [Pseudonocardiaceae bacterium]|jgi:peptide/nickel transport system substrate-binding protein|nr:ABC transporter substrate-binding protein [Pseudonocardiaceae bacterium]
MTVRRRFLLPIIPVLVLAGACTGTPTPAAGGPDNTAMVLAEPAEPATLNPLAGYAPNGAAKIYDGLYEYQADGTLKPVLATSLPVPSADGRSWTVTLRTGVRFSDDTPLAIVDVLATYRAVINPAFASPLRGAYSMLKGVDEVSPTTVRFDLAYPYAPFPDKLVLGIVPAPALTTPRPVTGLPLNTHPVGTGPYELVSWTKGKQLVLAANPYYPAVLGGPPKVKKVTVQFVPDDTGRVAKLKAGTLDGAAVAPSQAAEFTRSDAFSVLTDHAADLRAIQLPAAGRVTGDKAVRLALNQAVDRQSLVNKALNGAGTPAATPMPAVLPEFVEPTATFTRNQDQARTELLNAGWVANTSGGRSKGGVPAAFRLDYPTGDAVDAALATAFVADAKAIGITVTAVAVPPARLSAKAAQDAVLISTGNPFDPDLGLYPLLDSAMGDPSGYRDAKVNAALDTGRHTLDPAQRAVAYRQFQKAYVADPAMVCLVFADHTYVMRDNWTGYTPVVDGPQQGVTWGPWWNLQSWTPR